ncbi:1-acyl-sn-glycerol-3-phosphate acyltransferase [Myxococcota bacterium]|jgi:1-acyl-sn-glycerol-3-phosphate acyltransferase|nr:1-acyl-sn-glycerol-3-phosphate acyltransferase [Myxococcota bacterium]
MPGPRFVADPEILAALKPAERFAYALGAQLNETTWGKRLSMAWGHNVAQPGLALTINNRLRLFGAEHLPARSIILATNHRTWFDQFAVMIATWDHYPQAPFLYCPVRSAFYYERPLGVALNLLVSGNAMYPPVFRDDRGPLLNRNVVDACVRLLEWTPRAVVAMHPEGTRNQGDDPYSFLPPKAGIGRIALAARAPIIPSFVNGLPRTFKKLLEQRVTKGVEPVRVFLGPAVPLDDLYDRPDDREAHHEAATRTMTAIAALGEADRAFMATWRPD